MTQVLYRKWRPVTFEEVVGQDHVSQTLRNALALGRIGHAYLFAGPRGTGKTTTARLLAKAVNCLAEEPAARPCNTCHICVAVNKGRFLDLIEIDAASNTGVDDVRDLRDKIGFSPNEGRYKVYIVDEAHMLSTAAFNALLKTLEEPPAHAIFVLATTEAHKLPATVLSRCQRFEFRRISQRQIVARLERLLDHEGVAAESAALDLVARQAGGALRDAESLLDQLMSGQLGTITLAQAQRLLGTASNEAVEQLVAAWAAADSADGLDAIQAAVDEGTDPQQFARQVVDYVRGILFLKTGGAFPPEIPESWYGGLRERAKALDAAELVSGIRRFSTAIAESRGGWQPQLPVELAFVECVADRLRSTSIAAAVAEADVQAPRDEDRPLPESGETPAITVTAPTTGSAVKVGQVQERWASVLAGVKQRDFRVEAMLRSGEGALAVDGDVVVLGFKYGLHREKLESEEWRQVVEGALSETMSARLRIRCVDPKQYRAPRAPGPIDPVGISDSDAAGAPANAQATTELDALDPNELDELKRFGREDLNARVVE